MFTLFPSVIFFSATNITYKLKQLNEDEEMFTLFASVIFFSAANITYEVTFSLR
jgi:hypothetical protein